MKRSILGCILSIFALAPIKWVLVEEMINKLDRNQNIMFRLQQDLIDLCQRLLPKIFTNQSIKIVNLEKNRVELEELHLVRSSTAGVYQLHQLIREYFQEKLGELSRDKQDKLKHNFVELMVAKSKTIPKEENPKKENIQVFEWNIPHIMEVGNYLNEYLTKEDQEIYSIYSSVAKFYECQRLYYLALPWHEKCVVETKKRLGQKHLDVAYSCTNLAELFRVIGEYQQSEHFYSQALQLYKELLGEEHYYVAESIINLALIYQPQGKYEQSESLLLKIKPKLEKSSFLMANCLNGLGELYFFTTKI